MELNIEELIKAGFNRNMIIADKFNKELGNYTNRLAALMHQNMYGEITEILQYNGKDDGTATKLFEELNGILPYCNYQTEFLCVGINRPLIEKNGLKSEYVLLGAY